MLSTTRLTLPETLSGYGSVPSPLHTWLPFSEIPGFYFWNHPPIPETPVPKEQWANGQASSPLGQPITSVLGA